MNINKIVDALTGINYRFSTRQQLFNFYISLSVLLYGIAIITVMLLDLNEWYGISSVALQVINIYIWYQAVIKHRYSQSIYLFIVINSIAIVVLFFVNGGWNGPMPLGVMVALFLTLYLLPKSWQALAISYSILLLISGLEYFFPEWVIPYPDTDTARISYISATFFLTFFMYAGFVITQRKMVENIDRHTYMLKQSKDESETLLEELQTNREELSAANDYLQKLSKKLNESQRKYYDLLTQLRGMVYRWRFEQNGQANIEFISNGCVEITGYSPTDFTSKKIDYLNQVIHPDDKNAVWDEIQQKIDNGQPYNVTYRIITSSNQIKWVNEKGEAVYENLKPTYLEGFINDVTEIKTKETHVNLLNDVLNTTNDAVAIINQNDMIMYANASALTYAKADAKSIIGKPLHVIPLLQHLSYKQIEKELINDHEWKYLTEQIHNNGTITKVQISAKKISTQLVPYVVLHMRNSSHAKATDLFNKTAETISIF